MIDCHTPGNRFLNRKAIPTRPRIINTDNTQTSMRALFLLAIMVVDIAALISSGNPLQTAQRCDTMLTPSQIPTLRKHKHKSEITQDSCVLPAASSFLIPSQVGGAKFRASKTTSTQIATSSSSVHDVDPSVKKPKPKKKNPPKKGTKLNAGPNDATTLPTGGNTTKTNNKPKRRQRKLSSGNLPDVLWRHIPLEHIRKHPQFVPLPTPESIHVLESTEDVRNFRQESWQWDVLHEGRMTTSQAVAALGFLEPRAGDILGVPRGLRRGGQGAYYRLRKPVAVTTLEEMNAMLCNGSGEDDVSGSTDDEDVGKCWVQPPNYPFAAKYTLQITENEYKKRRQIASHYAQKNWSIRMVWGNVQEATSLLTALNYFWKSDKRILMKEIGMCGAGLSFNQTSHSGSGLLLGATPDAILCHPDGRIEAVEVKNHCPFVPNNGRYNRNNDKRSKQEKNAAFRLSQQTLSSKGAFMSQYIPQLMMEMLCLGENCKSAIMVRQTATSGALILRIARDDEWIEEMIYWLERFHNDFVQNETPPPENFFLESADPTDQTRYKKFLDLTKQVESKVELLEHVPHRSIQRAMAKHPVSSDLFLD